MDRLGRGPLQWDMRNGDTSGLALRRMVLRKLPKIRQFSIFGLYRLMIGNERGLGVKDRLEHIVAKASPVMNLRTAKYESPTALDSGYTVSVLNGTDQIEVALSRAHVKAADIRTGNVSIRMLSSL